MAAEARPSLHLSKCQIVGNPMPRLIIIRFREMEDTEVKLRVLCLGEKTLGRNEMKDLVERASGMALLYGMF